jgi:replicative DNA helicase
MSDKSNMPVFRQRDTGGKMPPQDSDLEEIMLGSIMYDNKAFIEIMDILHEDVFYKEKHQLIYRAIIELNINRKPIDIVTVCAKIKEQGNMDTVGGPFVITQLTNRVGTTNNIRFHALILKQYYLKREVIRIGSEMINGGYDESTDAITMVNNIGVSYNKLIQEIIQHRGTKTVDVVREVGLKIKKTMESQVIDGQETGFPEIDHAVLNFQGGQLIIIAARPGMGKTAFALSIIHNISVIASPPIRTAIASLEMSAQELVMRLLAMGSGVNSRKIRKGELTEPEVDRINTAQEFINENLAIDDEGAINIEQFRAKAIRWVNGGVKLIVVDYLQLMSGMGEKGREAEISNISRGLKAIAKELDVPIIALSQLNREADKREGKKKRPQLSDLRESGAIEQDADIVIFLFRPDYYKEQEDKSRDSQGFETEQEVEIIIAKQRNGPTGTKLLLYDGRVTRFMNMPKDEKNWQPPQIIEEF